MQERSEEQIISRLFGLENEGQAERRAELSGENYLSLIHDPDSGRGYVLKHGIDETEGAEVPPGTEFWEYPTLMRPRGPTTSCSRSPDRRVSWSKTIPRKASATPRPPVPEVRDRYSASDEDLLIDVDEVEDSGAAS